MEALDVEIRRRSYDEWSILYRVRKPYQEEEIQQVGHDQGEARDICH